MVKAYNNILNTASKFHLSVSEAKVMPSVHYLAQYFKEAQNMNPSLARMAFQQAHVDALEVIHDQFAEGEIDAESMKEKTMLLLETTSNVQKDSRFTELEKRIIKEYPKTGKKRIALAPCILDSAMSGLSSIRHSKEFEKMDSLLYKLAKLVVINANPLAAAIEEEIAEDKFVKKLNYFIKRALFK